MPGSQILYACILGLSLSIAPVAAQDAEPNLDRIEQLAKSAPPDVAAFVSRMMECLHWAGEEPYDAARRREINRALRSLGCAPDRLDRSASALRAKYSSESKILSLIELARGLY